MMLEVREQLVKRKKYERFLRIEEHSGARDLRGQSSWEKKCWSYIW